jgi:malonyl-CoA O-methyltransferase
MQRPPKPHIRHAFDRAAGTYDSAAAFQRLVCERLLARLPAIPPPAAIVDAGCGTGYGAKLLAERWPAAALVLADFAPAMLAGSASQGLAVCADIEALPFQAGTFELYWSSLAVQWCDLSHSLAEAARSLAPGGRLALSTLGPGTFAEIDAAFASATASSDPHRHVLDFLPPEAVHAACVAAGLRDIVVEREAVAIHYPDLKTLLRAIKAIGAQGVANRRPTLLGKNAWRRIEADYERHRSSAGLPATYDVIYCTAQR